jgi:hypothetical protein
MGDDEFVHFEAMRSLMNFLIPAARGQRLGHASSSRCAPSISSRLMNGAGQIDFPPRRDPIDNDAAQITKCESRICLRSKRVLNLELMHGAIYLNFQD